MVLLKKAFVLVLVPKRRWFQHIPTPDWMIFNENVSLFCLWQHGMAAVRLRNKTVTLTSCQLAQVTGILMDFDSVATAAWDLFRYLLTFSDIFNFFNLHHFINLISLVETWDVFLRPLPDYVVADEEHPGLEHRSTLQLHLGSSWAADGLKGFGG